MVKPVERIVERRQIRRAAEEALDEAPTDPRLPIIELPDEIDDDPARNDLPPGFGGAPHHTNGYAPHPATAPAFTTLTFRARPEPWYRSNAAKIALLIAGLVAAVASLVVLLWPTSTPAPQDAGTTTAPAPSPSASVTPTQSGKPSLLPPLAPPPVGLPPPPPPPPPAEPPPPAAPQQPRYYPRYTEPTQEKPPQIDVTRAPISVAPKITQTPAHATPGQNKGGGGWGW